MHENFFFFSLPSIQLANTGNPKRLSSVQYRTKLNKPLVNMVTFRDSVHFIFLAKEKPGRMRPFDIKKKKIFNNKTST